MYLPTYLPALIRSPMYLSRILKTRPHKSKYRLPIVVCMGEGGLLGKGTWRLLVLKYMVVTTRCKNKKYPYFFQKLPKKWVQMIYFKEMFFKIGLKVNEYFLKKSCNQELWKIT